MKHYWKAQANWGWLVLLVVLGIMWVLLLNGAFMRGPARSVHDAALILEVYLPLAAAVLLAGVPVLDRDAGAAELHLTYRRPAALHLLSLLMIPVALWLLAAVASAWITDQYYIPLTLVQAVQMSLPPALGLGAAALVCSALARHQVGGMMAAAVWWGIDVQVPGRLNTWFYLFPTFRPLPDPDPAEMRRNVVLLAIGAVWLALWLAGRRERWVSGRAE